MVLFSKFLDTWIVFGLECFSVLDFESWMSFLDLVSTASTLGLRLELKIAPGLDFVGICLAGLVRFIRKLSQHS